MMRATKKELELDPFRLKAAVVADVRFDGHRVWSVTIPYSTDGRIIVQWPKALAERLRGRSRVSVHDSGTGEELDAVDVRFDRSRDRLRILDARGRWLAMTKWDRLGPVLEGREDDVSGRLLHSARRLVDLLEEEGFQTYMVGGTLLGAIRNGGMLPHDDDVDLAFLCEADNPADIGLDSYRMERALTAAGFTVIRHSLAHLEIEFFNDQGEPDHYVDIFTGFFRGDDYCQPFALRGPEVQRDDLVPTAAREVDGVELPEPAHPEAWLAYGYGPDWRVPDPGFKFVTPRHVRLEFESWFGVYNRGRVYWDKHYLAKTTSSGFTAAERSIDVFSADVPAGARVLDLGCGDGAWSLELARRGFRVTGVDYSHEALRLARAQSGAQAVDFRYLNLNDRAALMDLGTQILQTREPWYVFAHHSLQALTAVNRRGVYVFLEMILRGDGFAQLTNDTALSAQYVHGKPSTWHLPIPWLMRETAPRKLRVDVLAKPWRVDGRRLRRTAITRLVRDDAAASMPEETREGDA